MLATGKELKLLIFGGYFFTFNEVLSGNNKVIFFRF